MTTSNQPPAQPSDFPQQPDNYLVHVNQDEMMLWANAHMSEIVSYLFPKITGKGEIHCTIRWHVPRRHSENEPIRYTDMIVKAVSGVSYIYPDGTVLPEGQMTPIDKLGEQPVVSYFREEVHFAFYPYISSIGDVIKDINAARMDQNADITWCVVCPYNRHAALLEQQEIRFFTYPNPYEED